MSKHEKVKKKLRGETETIVQKEITRDCNKCPMRWLRKLQSEGCLAKPFDCETYLSLSNVDFEGEYDGFISKPMVTTSIQKAMLTDREGKFIRYDRYKITRTTTHCGTVVKIEELPEEKEE